jgi:23S rRNA (uracil1939-C5)-methyltransferase
LSRGAGGPGPAPACESATVVGLTHEGEGVVHEGKTAFVPGALPGEIVRFERVRRRRHHDEARLLEVLEPAPARVPPRCAHFGVCGGCALQHLDPAEQLALKERELRESLGRLARVEPRAWLAPLAGPAWGYRRRARLGAKYVDRKERVVVGFRERGRPYVADLRSCEVLVPQAARLIGPLAELIGSLEIRRRLPQVELAAGDDAIALVLRVLSAPCAGDIERLGEFAVRHGVRIYLQPGGLATVEALPGADAAVPLHYRLPDFGLELEFAPNDFIQVNAPVNQALVARAVELLAPDGAASVLDLYCGLGNFTLALARRAASVVGVEGERALIERARHNARRNGLANAEFHCADLARPGGLGPWAAGRYTHVLLDPPRMGAREILPLLARLEPRRLLYISCHPGSLARDLGVLVHEHGFALDAAGVVDMFPHTAHVESVALLRRAGDGESQT